MKNIQLFASDCTHVRATAWECGFGTMRCVDTMAPLSPTNGLAIGQRNTLLAWQKHGMKKLKNAIQNFKTIPYNK
jgi:hypothetical protein